MDTQARELFLDMPMIVGLCKNLCLILVFALYRSNYDAVGYIDCIYVCSVVGLKNHRMPRQNLISFFLPFSLNRQVRKIRRRHRCYGLKSDCMHSSMLFAIVRVLRQE